MKLEERKEYNKLLKWHNDNFDKLCGLKKEKGKVKMFNLIPETTRFKKIKSSLKKAVIHLNLLGLLFFIACGSDNPVNNGNNPPLSNEIVNLDSLTLYSPNTVNDTAFRFVNNDFDSLKISFTASTNCVNSEVVSLNISVIDTTNNFIFANSINEANLLNQSYEFYLKTTSLNYDINFALNLFEQNRFVKLYDIKVTKVQ